MTSKNEKRMGIVLGVSLVINGLLFGFLTQILTLSPIIHGFLLGAIMPLFTVLGMSCILVFGLTKS